MGVHCQPPFKRIFVHGSLGIGVVLIIESCQAMGFEFALRGV